MEVCILKFYSVDGADDALKTVLNAEGDRNPWLHDAGVIRRPLIGRISVRATYADDQAAEVKQGDVARNYAEVASMTAYLLGSLVGPLHAEMAAMEAESRGAVEGRKLEKKLLRIDDIKSVLPRGSSAVVLIATPEINDQFASYFGAFSPEIIRRDVALEVQRRLEKFQRTTMKDLADQRSATH